MFTTINRSALSAVAAIGVAEYALGLLPVGTHHWDKFVTPAELKQALIAAHPSIEVDATTGLMYDPVLTRRWSIAPPSLPLINYAVTAFRTPKAVEVAETNVEDE